MKTTMDNQKKIQIINKNPVKGVNEKFLAQHMVNALAIAMNISWGKAFNKLIEQTHKLCLMPDDIKCVSGMLEEEGFVLQPSIKGGLSVADICQEMDNHCNNGEIAIVTSCKYSEYGNATVILPENDGSYICKGAKDVLDRRAYDVWIRWPDGKDYSPIPRRKRRKASDIRTNIPHSNNDFFHYKMQNPANNNTNDCMIRALASVLGITWHDAMDELFRISNYGYVGINCGQFLDMLLQEKGYVPHPKLKKNGNDLTAIAFCKEMDKRYHNGERILSVIGRHHVAAIIPTVMNDVTVYQVEDSWDSSLCRVDMYWVEDLLKKDFLKPSVCHTRYKEGEWIIHPSLGKGCIANIRSAKNFTVLEIHFDSHKGLKRLYAKWVDENCKLVSA